MTELNFPKYDFRVKNEAGKHAIFDKCRKKFVALTPEEWVRQNMVEFLTNEKQFPISLIANEIAVEINSMKKRCDTVIFNSELRLIAIVEYKAPQIAINQKVFDQIATYNLKLNVPLLIVSNGLTHVCCQIDYTNRRYNFFKEIPTYNELKSLSIL